jgi:hypothetical protein
VTRLGFQIRSGDFKERFIATTFPVERFSEDAGLEGGCLFLGESERARLSTSSYELARDPPNDLERAGIFSSDDFERRGRRMASSRAARAIRSNRIALPVVRTGML